MSKIANIYAASLFELALEENIDKELRDNVKGLCAPFERDSQLVELLAAPMFTMEEKCAVLDEIFAGKVNKYLLNFFKVMTERKVPQYIKEAMEKYVDVYNKHYDIEKVTATTAVELSDELKEKLTKKLESVTGKTIFLENEVDENTVGGIVVKFSDTELNDSIANKLKNIKEELAKV